MEKWKSLKPITIQAILEQGVDRYCSEFLDFVSKVVHWNTSLAFGEITPDFAQETLLSIKPDSTWFIDHGFIEKVEEPEKFWKVGDRVNISDFEYVIARLGGSDVAFYNSRDNITWDGVHKVGNDTKITLSEMRAMGFEGE